jgi:hypothetical protein
MKTALAVLALAAMEGCATRTPAAPAPAASHADGSRRSVVRADTIDPVAVAPRWLNWRHPPLAWDEERFYSLSVGNDPKPGRFP